MISLEIAGDSQEDVDENGPKAVMITAHSAADRKALAILVATITAGLPALQPVQPVQPESNDAH